METIAAPGTDRPATNFLYFNGYKNLMFISSLNQNGKHNPLSELVKMSIT